MFGSNDDKKTSAPAAEKKGLFGWLRKKPQETAADQPQDETSAAPAPVVDQAQVAVDPSFASQLEPGTLLDPAVQAHPPESLAPKPWLVLPVAEESVALVDEREPHVTPAIAPQDNSTVQPLPGVIAEPLVAVDPVPVPERVIVSEAPVKSEPIIVVEALAVAAPVSLSALEVESAPTEANKIGFFARLKQGLSKTSASLGEGMASLFLGKKAIDDDLLEEIETRLLTADVGVEATSVIIQSLTQKVARKQLTDSDALYKSLQDELTALLKPVEQPLVITGQQKPFVILVVGVNGAGKTTTIGKLAKKLQLEGKKVMLAAGDTFRAAAVEQLQVWGERNNIPVIAQHTGADSASVIFDAVQAAKARGIDVLIADTAGRLHTKDNLMEELKKVRRVMGKLDIEAPHEVLLVLDAGTGQNAINQAKQFHQTVTLTGLALTKLDGTAKGGVIFALAKQFGLPIRYIGVGEGIDDLRTFEAEPFVQALFAERERT
ncbi:signal recognition particle-docking protein FtsY [Pseudomonas sp. 10B1]|uniref:signal recognition particle-docking protein FtsY n=1 Tax=unclassified Pseudomonas TaxID=196821 RepID=UPI002B235BE3|nr:MULTISPECIES: signal recognition particle-docking protein FtsY [unclassified Pseudomonas]MEA9994419.1 signal recognition particle-docking protein FtsY [Pseudomonas sp. AA4]MEB0087837.1 signal recognition particle-docking protein FtsY [Pseudomonas sp. RTI1]MEB0126673.1 signal recognition particle-docking protein FtsY [Pseudomonas sp. CCC1.2]MEB0154357.1 signal recognition particle-docking protein FtsY [Pseudomonas sp. CCC4.3]MEB0220946.1 signal recognition particle-docking protein FtsY [Pseu